MKLHLQRYTSNEKQTLGTLNLIDDFGNVLFSCVTLELPWKSNAKNISCIPAGMYRAQMIWNKNYNYHFTISGVPNRSAILMHVGNYVTDTQGCILAGKYVKPSNKGEGMMICESQTTLTLLMQLVRKQTPLHVDNSLIAIEHLPSGM